MAAQDEPRCGTVLAVERHGVDLEFHELEMGYEHLRLRRPERERRLLASLAEKGQQVPIVMVPLPEDAGRYQVIDGYSRVRLLKRLGTRCKRRCGT